MNTAKYLLVVFSFLPIVTFGSEVRSYLPVDIGPIALQVKYLRLGVNRPFGTHEIKGSSFIVGQPKKLTKREAFGGLGGMFMANSRRKKAGKNIVGKHEALLKYDLVREVDRIVKEVATQWRGRTRFDPTLPVKGNTVMELEPWVYIGGKDNGKSGTINVYLRARLKDKNGNQIWRGGYNYTSPKQRPFDGRNGWFANNASHLKRTVNQGYRAAANIMMQDSQGSEAGWDNEVGRIRVYIPGGQKPKKVKVVILKRSKGMLIYTPKAPQYSPIYGVNMVPENSIEIIQQ